VCSGRAHLEILREASERQAGVIVMGMHGHGFVNRLMFGSTTDRVVRGATCPVLIVRGV
jgi:nucleotide-binding universal stress UspA family protein